LIELEKLLFESIFKIFLKEKTFGDHSYLSASYLFLIPLFFTFIQHPPPSTRNPLNENMTNCKNELPFSIVIFYTDEIDAVENRGFH